MIQGLYKAKNLFPSGIVMNGDLSKVIEVDAEKIAEDVAHAWYEGTGGALKFLYEGDNIPKIYQGLGITKRIGLGLLALFLKRNPDWKERLTSLWGSQRLPNVP